MYKLLFSSAAVSGAVEAEGIEKDRDE